MTGHSNINFSRLILTVLITIRCFVGFSQISPEKMKLSQTFIDSMHFQTREHVIIDTLSNYYNQFNIETLNQVQKDLVFIRNFQDTLYSYDFIKSFINHSDLILVNAFEVFQRVKCITTQSKIEDYRKLYDQYKVDIEKGIVPDLLNEESPLYNADEEIKLFQTLTAIDTWITMLPREKVLSIFDYIIDNKTSLYD